MPNAEFYSALGSKYEDAFAHDPGLLTFIQTALNLLPPAAHVLDAGCGTGRPVASSLAAAGHRVTGIDISDEMVSLSRKAVPEATFEVADLRDYRPMQRLDAVFNILSLFLLNRQEIEDMAGRWATWLETGGILSICTFGAEDVAKDKAAYDADGLCVRDHKVRFMGEMVPVTLFTKQGWKELLEAKGFEIVDQRTEVFVPPKEALTDDEPHYFVIAKKVR